MHRLKESEHFQISHGPQQECAANTPGNEAEESGPGTGSKQAHSPADVGFVAAGVAILTGVKARLAAVLMTAMLASFALLVHAPILLADHSSHWNWTEGAVNLAVMGAAWVVADSLARPRRQSSFN